MAAPFNPFDISMPDPAAPAAGQQAAPPQQPGFNPFDVDMSYQAGQPTPPVSAPNAPTGQPQGGSLDDIRRMSGAAVAQGAIKTYQDLNLLARELGEKLGVTTKEKTAAARADFNTERQQYQNLDVVKKYPISSSIIQGVTNVGLEMIPATKIAKAGGLIANLGSKIPGIGARMGSGLAVDAAATGITGTMQDPGQTDSPFLARAGEGLKQGGIGALVSAPFRFLGGLRGAPIAENIAGQQANAAALEKVGGGSVGQVIGDTQGLMGPRVAAFEAETAKKVPFVGGDDAFYAQQENIKKAQKEFVSSVKPKPEDVASLTPEEYAAATEKGLHPTDAAINKAYDEIRGATAQIKSIDPTPLVKEVDDLSKALGTNISKTPSVNLVQGRIADLKNSGDLNFEKLWDFRKTLDDSAFTEAGVMKAGAKGSEALADLRDLVSKRLQSAADDIGIGPRWKEIAGQYAQNQTSKQLEKLMQDASSPLGRSGISPGRGLLSFAKQLETKQKVLGRSLTPEQKQTMKGVINVTKLAAKQLRIVTPGIDTLGASASAGAAGAAAAMFGAGPASAMAGLTWGLTSMLYSKAGRELLTYAGKTPLTSLKLQQIAMRILQTATLGGTTQASTQQKEQGGY